MEDRPLLNECLNQIRDISATIFAFLDDAWDLRETASEDSAEWHKRRGEILAYTRMVSLLSEVEDLLYEIEAVMNPPARQTTGDPRARQYGSTLRSFLN